MHLLQAATKILARQLVRLRQQIANLQGSRAQMRGIATHTQVHCSSGGPSDANFGTLLSGGGRFFLLTTLIIHAGIVCSIFYFCRHERC